VDRCYFAGDAQQLREMEHWEGVYRIALAQAALLLLQGVEAQEARCDHQIGADPGRVCQASGRVLAVAGRERERHLCASSQHAHVFS
jgi:hypothetical protein